MIDTTTTGGRREGQATGGGRKDGAGEEKKGEARAGQADRNLK